MNAKDPLTKIDSKYIIWVFFKAIARLKVVDDKDHYKGWKRKRAEKR